MGDGNGGVSLERGINHGLERSGGGDKKVLRSAVAKVILTQKFFTERHFIQNIMVQMKEMDLGHLSKHF